MYNHGPASKLVQGLTTNNAPDRKPLVPPATPSIQPGKNDTPVEANVVRTLTTPGQSLFALNAPAMSSRKLEMNLGATGSQNQIPDLKEARKIALVELTKNNKLNC